MTRSIRLSDTAGRNGIKVEQCSHIQTMQLSLLCQLYLFPVRFGPGEEWYSGYICCNHRFHFALQDPQLQPVHREPVGPVALSGTSGTSRS